MTIIGYKKRLATRAALDYKMVDLIAPSISRVMSKNAKFPKFEDAYPGFSDEIGRPELEEEQKTARVKAWLLQYAEANNAKRRGNK